MNTRTTARSVEVLESRIAPATLVDGSFVNGVLVLNGTDNLDHSVEIVQVNKTQFIVRGLNDTLVDIDGDGVGDTEQTLTGKITSIIFNGGTQADALFLRSIAPIGSLTFNGGAGDDNLEADNLVVKGAVNLDFGAGGGGDQATFGGTFTNISGSVNINLVNASGGSVVLNATALTSIKGPVEILGGDGGNSLSFSSAIVRLGDTFTFETGNGANNLSFDAQLLVLGGKGNSFVYNGGTSSDTASLNADVLVSSGALVFEGAAGPNQFSIDGGKVRVGKNAIGKSVLYTGGADSDSLSIDVDQISTGGSIEFLGSSDAVLASGAGDNTVSINVTASAKIGKSGANNALVVQGDFTDTSTTVGITGANVKLGGNVNVSGVNGDTAITVDAKQLSVVGALTVATGAGTDTASFTGNGVIKGDVDIDLGATVGTQSATLESADSKVGGLKLVSTLTVNSTSTLVDDAGTVGVLEGDYFTLTNVKVGKATSVTMGTGDSFVTIDNLQAGGSLAVVTNGGADTVAFERGTFAGSSSVKGAANFDLGEGDDTLLIGDNTTLGVPLGVNSTVKFLAAVIANGGTGTNTRNAFETMNTFKVAPVIQNF